MTPRKPRKKGKPNAPARALAAPEHRPKIVRARKGKGSYRRRARPDPGDPPEPAASS